ncbi:MAG: nickel pincer cofactor biosynthesis protein LarC [Kiritimatiellae bacterium]|nr:nickel pincer cofactor biosynthesis protein LarC [Kiritimatiellia bacterium]
MKRLHFDCSMGAAGDMIAAALLELAPDAARVVESLNSLGMPGVSYSLERVQRCGIAASRLVVKVHGEEEQSRHRHHHAHHSLDDIFHVVDSLRLDQKVRGDIKAVYRLLADAESRAHGRPVAEVHFHEVGALDAIADIAAACLLVSRLSPCEITASPVNLGAGTVRCSHGTVSVPAPATAILLEGMPVHGDGEVAAELCTPTGAALLRHFAARFCEMPEMKMEKSGCGAGSRDLAERANVLRAFLGEPSSGGADEVCEFRCSIDDMTGEDMAFASERIFGAGALDVVFLPATMKKGRPGVVLEVLAPPPRRDDVLAAIFRHTSTTGLRERICRRVVLDRHEETVEIPSGAKVRIKTCEGHGVVRRKVEHDDVAAIARESGLSIGEALNEFFERDLQTRSR